MTKLIVPFHNFANTPKKDKMMTNHSNNFNGSNTYAVTKRLRVNLIICDSDNMENTLPTTRVVSMN
jgi:hypothetical protein